MNSSQAHVEARSQVGGSIQPAIVALIRQFTPWAQIPAPIGHPTPAEGNPSDYDYGCSPSLEPKIDRLVSR